MKVDAQEVEHRLDRFRTATKAAGVRLTPQRLEIFRAVAASLEHPDAEAVFRLVRKRMPTVSLDTVYRTLWRLNDLGLVTTLGPRRESARFDANLNHHHHFFCVHCGLARDFVSAELDALRLPAEALGSGRILDARVTVRGICDTCTKKWTEKSNPSNLKKQPTGERRKT